MRKSYTWPGNVRELENVISRLMVFQNGVTRNRRGCRTLVRRIARINRDQPEARLEDEFDLSLPISILRC